MEETPARRARIWPFTLASGLILIAIFWPLNWCLPGLRTHLLFFPLWLGYILAVDGLVCWRRGASLLTRRPGAFLASFPLSSLFWWYFELLNWRTRNWHYLGREQFGDLEYFLLASLSFSTVIPAVFETAELLITLPGMTRLRRGPRCPSGPRRRVACFLAGLATLGLTLAWPRYFFPFVWISPFLLVEPVNAWLGHRTLELGLASGDWRPAVSLALGALVCGFFWEMWNYFSYPKWVYTIPWVGWGRIFEMPLLGYGGYLPFGLALFSLYHLASGLLGDRRDEGLLSGAP